MASAREVLGAPGRGRTPPCARPRKTRPRRLGTLWSRPCTGGGWRTPGRQRLPPRGWRASARPPRGP
eukprot:8888307-Pyramimonas_sp.AAC.1